MAKKKSRKTKRLKRLIPGGNQMSKGVLPRPVHIVYERVMEPRSTYTFLDWEKGEQLPPWMKHLQPNLIVDKLPRHRPLKDEQGKKLRSDERWTGYRPPPKSGRGVSLSMSGPNHPTEVDALQAAADKAEWESNRRRLEAQRANRMDVDEIERATIRQQIQPAPTPRFVQPNRPIRRDMSIARERHITNMDVQREVLRFDPMQVAMEGGLTGVVQMEASGGGALQVAPRTPSRQARIRGPVGSPPPKNKRPAFR